MFHCFITMTRPSMSQLRSNAEKAPQRNPDGQEAAFSIKLTTENKKQNDTEVIQKEVEGGTEDQVLPEGEPVRILGNMSTEGFGEETKHSELGSVTSLQHVISNIEKEMAKNPTFMQKGIDTRNTNNAMVALITMKTSMSRAFSEQ